MVSCTKCRPRLIAIQVPSARAKTGQSASQRSSEEAVVRRHRIHEINSRETVSAHSVPSACLASRIGRRPSLSSPAASRRTALTRRHRDDAAVQGYLVSTSTGRVRASKEPKEGAGLSPPYRSAHGRSDKRKERGVCGRPAPRQPPTEQRTSPVPSRFMNRPSRRRPVVSKRSFETPRLGQSPPASLMRLVAQGYVRATPMPCVPRTAGWKSRVQLAGTGRTVSRWKIWIVPPENVRRRRFNKIPTASSAQP